MSFIQKFARHFWSWIDTGSTKPVDNQNLEGIDWFRLVPFLGMHLICFAVIWVGWSLPAVLTAAFMYFIRMFFVTGVYHRYFSHRTYKTTRWFQFVLGIAANSCVQKGPLWWAAHHRHHHRHSDEEEDVHSPHQDGLFYSHVGWITMRKNFPTNLKAVPDLAKYPELLFLDRFDTLVPVVLAIGMFYFGVLLQWMGLNTTGPQMLIWGFFISTVLLFHGTCTINSLSHIFGSRRYATTDLSRNNFWLALVTLGEGWHNNHHHYPGATRQGFYWWEVDITFYMLRLLSWTGLIWDLNGVPNAVREKTIAATGAKDITSIPHRGKTEKSAASTPAVVTPPLLTPTSSASGSV